MGFFTVNKRLLPIKLHYFLYNAGAAPVQPTMPVYAKVFKFSSFIVGVIYTILPIVNLILKPICGGIADKFQFHRGMNFIWVVLTLLSFFVVQFIPQSELIATDDLDTNYTAFNLSICTSELTPNYFKVDTINATWICLPTEKIDNFWNLSTHNEEDSPRPNIGCTSLFLEAPIYVNKAICKVSHGQAKEGAFDDDGYFDSDSTFSQWQFWVFLILVVLSGGAVAVVNTLSDTMCIEICGDSSLFGQQRVWGSLGWGIFAVINGFLVDAFSVEGEDKNYTPSFYLMLAPLLIDIVVFYYLKVEIPQKSESIVRDAWRVLMNPRAYLFMFWCTMMGASLGLLWNFLYWFLEELATAQGGEVNAQIKTIEGLVAGIQTFLGEAPAFFFGSKIIKTIGYGHTVSVILGVIALRFTIYSFIVNPWWCLPVEILQSDYGLFYSTMTSYGKKIALPGTEATIQSVFGALMEGVGVALGSFIAGVLFDNYDGSTAFRIFGISFFIMLICNEVLEFILSRFEQRNREEEKTSL